MARTLSVDDEAWILLKGREARESGQPVYLETRQMPGWTAPLSRYLLWCADCAKFTIMHPHGYTERLQCHRCHTIQLRLKPPPKPEEQVMGRLIGFRLLVLMIAALATILLFRAC